MKKIFSLLFVIMLTSMAASAARDWKYDANAYSNHAVVYAVLQDDSGTLYNDVYTGVTVGAFIDGECRASAEYSSTGSNNIPYVFTLRIGVNPDEGNKTVTFAVNMSGTEYTFTETLNVTGNDVTVGTPSKPYTLTFIPATSLSIESFSVDVNGTVNLREKLVPDPANAMLPDNISYDFANSKSYINVENDILTGLSPNTDGAYLGISFMVGSSKVSTDASVIVNKPITGLSLNPDYADGFTVNVYDDKTLYDNLAKAAIITPADATEQLVWEPSDKNAFERIETNRYSPKLPGTYTMTATAKCGSTVTVKVIVRQPVEKYAVKFYTITVALGDEVTQYLPHTFTLYPENATDPMSGLSYSVASGEDVLNQGDDGKITAIGVGEATIHVKHVDLVDPFSITVNVIKVPQASDISIGRDPLAIEVAEDALGQADVTQDLKDNMKFGDYAWDNFTWADTNAEGEKVLQINSEASTSSITVIALKYGSTRFEGTMTYTISGFGEDGAFTDEITKEVKIGFAVNIVQALTAISINPVTIGMEESGNIFEISTTPEGYLLSDNVEFNIPYSEAKEPIFSLERIDGTNKWKITPNFVGKGEFTVGIRGTNFYQTTDAIVSQKLIYKEGWYWVSMYAGKVDATYFDKYFYEVQEFRSQTALSYNDSEYGFFGTLEALDGTSSYKMNIKAGQNIEFLIPTVDLYNLGTKEYTVNAGWYWLNNPYCLDHAFSDIFAGVKLNDNSRIVTQNGFMVYTNGEWQGSIKRVKAGEGILVYNAGTQNATISLDTEISVPKYSEEEGTTAFDVYSEKACWDYDANKFADNMTIIATIPGAEAGRYEIGAYIGGECRGEGVLSGSRHFITVHGETGEQVTFRIFDRATGEYIDAENVTNFAAMEGTMAKPLAIKAEISGIENVDGGDIDIILDGDSITVNGVAEDAVKVYNIAGQQVKAENLEAGVYIVKINTTGGVITRKVVVK